MIVRGHLRLALRTLVRSPLFALTAIGSLAIGVAGSSTIFSLADALFLRPRPGLVSESRLVDIGRATDGRGFDNFGYQLLLALRQATQVEGVAGFRIESNAVSVDNGRGGSDRAFATTVTANYFAVLGTRAAAGRLFRGDEDRVPDGAPVAVISHAFWARRFGASSDAVGRSLRINGRPYTIVGVAEPGFQGSSIVGADMWVPFAMAPHLLGRDDMNLLTAHGVVWHLAIARLKPGATVAALRDELNGLLAPLKDAHPDIYGRWSIAVEPSGRIPGDDRATVLGFIAALFALTFTVLIIACSNAAGMLLARGLAREREFAARMAMGASRRQLISLLLTETFVLAGAGALASVALAVWMVAALESLLPKLPVPLAVHPVIDGRALLAALGLALGTALTFGIAPALGATRLDLAGALHGLHNTPDRRRLCVRHGLAVLQVALALMLLVTTGLFVRGLQRAARFETGYDGRGVRIFSIDANLAGARGQHAVALAARLLERIASIDGVEVAATSRMIPLQGGGLGLGGLRIPGFAGPRGDDIVNADWDVVSPAFFETLRVPIVAGRGFTSDDRDGSPLVAIVNQTFAERAWPGRDAVGEVLMQETTRNAYDRRLIVVGVARNANYRMPGETARAFIYVPLAQQPMTEMNLYVREAPGRNVSADVGRAIAEVEPNLPIISSQSFEEAAGIGLLPQRVAAWIGGGVGLVGLVLAGLGLYGVMAFHAVQRTREVAVRMALGATRAQVRTLLLRQASSIVLAGATAGGALSSAAALSLRGLLVGVGPFDGIAFASAAAMLSSILLTAAWLPVRRAADADPAAALRAE